MMDRARLTLGRPLGREGQGVLHEELSGKINGRWDAVYKEFDPGTSVEVPVLTAMTQLAGRLSPPDAAWLGEKAAWPAETVEMDGAVVGFLMRAVPHRFLRDVREPATLEHLIRDQGGSDRERLLVLADLADSLVRLHSMGIVVGGLSPRSVLFAVGGEPGCFLVGCDTMGMGGAHALVPADVPLPGDEPLGTPQSDGYLFALLVVRVLTRDPGAVDGRRLGAFGGGVADLAAAALQQPPFSRPVLSQWAARLREAAAVGAPHGAAAGTPDTAGPGTDKAAAPGGQAGSSGQAASSGRAGSSGRAKMVGIAATAGAIALVVLFVVGKNVLKNNVRAALTDSPDVTTTPTEVYTPPPAPTPTPTPTEEKPEFEVGDCLSGLPKRPAVDSCNDGAPYRVAHIVRLGEYCDGKTNHRFLDRGDVTYCIAYHFGRNHCYKWTKDEEYVDFAKCGAPRTYTVRRVVRNDESKDGSACGGVGTHYWTWRMPPMTVCVDKH
ncbi:hypothetical protein ACIBH1_17590 [Nonomuraea sp. NPDC050663]|uniref:hypothetical protein n=1 Tax=Nonomuraea sp. NPDC050663 TaxID=3364370 RepID=UPI0037B24F80